MEHRARDYVEGLLGVGGGRLLSVWQEEYRAWRTRNLADRDYVYVWANGVHFNVRLEDERLAALVVIGVRPDGTKEVIALRDCALQRCKLDNVTIAESPGRFKSIGPTGAPCVCSRTSWLRESLTRSRFAPRHRLRSAHGTYHWQPSLFLVCPTNCHSQ